MSLSAFLRDENGQDLIEYALLSGFVAVSAAAVTPNIAPTLSTIFSKVGSVLAKSTT